MYDGLTIGELKTALNKIPAEFDSVPVLQERVEDHYFEESNWESIQLTLDHPLNYEMKKDGCMNLNTDEVTPADLNVTSNWFQSWGCAFLPKVSPFNNKGIDYFCIHAHY